MPTLREAQYITRRATVEATLSEAVSALPLLQSTRGGSTPDDGGSGGFFEDDEDGLPVYQSWFRAGDVVGVNKVKPY